MSEVAAAVGELARLVGGPSGPTGGASGPPIVAVAGGTGSGKSSLVNVLAGVVATEVGSLRPTTSEAVAVFPLGSSHESAALDHLGVVRREAGRHRGPVLVDLPDLDSVVEGHRHLAEAVVERADAVIWVVDPEKYADAVVHETMERFSDVPGRVVCGHGDRLSGPDRLAILDDLRRLVGPDVMVSVVGVPPDGPAVGVDELATWLTGVQRIEADHATRARAEALLERVGPAPDPLPGAAWTAVEDGAAATASDRLEVAVEHLRRTAQRQALTGRATVPPTSAQPLPDLAPPTEWDAADPLVVEALAAWAPAADRLVGAVESVDVIATATVPRTRAWWLWVRVLVPLAIVGAVVAAVLAPAWWPVAAGGAVLVVLAALVGLRRSAEIAATAAADRLRAEAEGLVGAALASDEVTVQRAACRRAEAIAVAAEHLRSALAP